MFRAVLAAATATAVCASAHAGPTFLVTHNQNLYRVQGAQIDTFWIGKYNIDAAATDALGQVWMAGTHRRFRDRTALFQLTDVFDDPRLESLGDIFEHEITSLTWVNDVLHGIERVDRSLPERLVRVDTELLVTEYVGATGELRSRSPSTAFDPESQRLFGTVKGRNPKLHEIDWDLSNQPEPYSKKIGSTGVHTQTAGGEFFNGRYYNVISQRTGDNTHDLVLGLISLDENSAGEFTPIRTLATGLPRGAVSLAIIAPAPATVGALCFAGITLATRRGRQRR